MKISSNLLAVMSANKATAWEQPSFSDVMVGWATKSGDNWGAPVEGDTRHWSDCPSLDTSTMGLVHADGLRCNFGTCALRCAAGAIPTGQRRTRCRKNRKTGKWWWNRTLGTCKTCDVETPLSDDANMSTVCSTNTKNNRRFCKMTCPSDHTFGNSNKSRTKIACKCPRGPNGRQCKWYNRKTVADYASYFCKPKPTPAPVETTTAAATTAAPATEAPATEAPASEAPATEAPATEAPATEAPVTEAPATEAPATEAPATEAPATEAPATEAPATEAPATEAPATEAPATEAPATEAPATEAPATEAPATEAPATEAPATEAPATEAPATEAPATEAPATEAPATEAPATEAPATEAPATTAAPEFKALTDKIESGLTTCGSATRIVNGVDADANSWPWIVNFFFQDAAGVAGGMGYTCGGTVIDDRWVLTAAHCCQNQAGDTMTKAFMNFGQHNVATAPGSDAGEFSLQSATADIFIHESYGTTGGNNFDVCLVKTTESIFAAGTASGCGSGCVAAACIPDVASNHGDACWVAGWGTLTAGGSSPDILQSVGVNIFSDAYCQSNTFYGNQIQSDEMCAGLPDVDGNGKTDAGKDSCQGDSGGPLICNVGGKATVNGIVSWGAGCAEEGKPGVYGETFDYKSWITDKMANN